LKRSLFSSIPLAVGFLLANLGSAQAGTPAKTDSPAKPAGSSCDWVHELYKDRVSEACQSSLLGKIKVEQDRIYANRIFKDWQPMKDYEVVMEKNFLQFTNQKSGDFFQAQWLSFKPAIAYINGQLVIDESNDESMYRRIDRLIAKAEAANDKAEKSSVNAIRLFFLSNEAYAAVTQKSARDMSANGLFLFTMDGKSGTAEDFLNNSEDGLVSNSSLKEANVLPPSKEVGQGLTCDGKKLATSTQKIKGYDVVIKPVDRSTFVISGFKTKSDPNGSRTFTVRMDPDKDVAPRTWVKDKIKKAQKHKRRRGHWVRGVPCSSAFNEKINDVCKSAWGEMAGSDQLTEDQQNKIKEFVSQYDKAEGIQYGRVISCEKVFSATDDRRACRKFLNNKFPAGSYVNADNAKFYDCGDKDPVKGKCDELTEKDFSIVGKDNSRGNSETNQAAIDARMNYIKAMMADPARAKMDKQNGLRFNPVDHCPVPAEGKLTSVQKAGEELDVYDRLSGLECKPPYKGASADVQAAWAKVQKGGAQIANENDGSDFQDAVQRRLMGMMMLGDCCGSDTCKQTVLSKQSINLKGGGNTGWGEKAPQ
jgi:hypothetical protein